MSESKLTLRQASLSELAQIWKIIQHAIELRRLDGSDQWQNGYPNEAVLEEDIQNGVGFVLLENSVIIGYAAIIFDIEPAYNVIEGAWLSKGEYVVIHRVATSEQVKGRRMGQKLFELIEELAKSKGTPSIKVDTNFDNLPMLKILERLDYTYCGEVMMKGAPRKAFEKLI